MWFCCSKYAGSAAHAGLLRNLLHCALQRGWDVRDGAIHFQGSDEKPTTNHQPVELIDNALTYAREIERIV